MTSFPIDPNPDGGSGFAVAHPGGLSRPATRMPRDWIRPATSGCRPDSKASEHLDWPNSEATRAAPTRFARRLKAIASAMTVSFLLLAGALQAAGQASHRVHLDDGLLETAFRIEIVAENLRVPWDIEFLPDGRILFNERTGRVRIIEEGHLLEQPALELDVSQGNKMGLLGLLADPDFAENGFLYLAWNYPNSEEGWPRHYLRVERYRLDGNRLTEPFTLIDRIPANRNHTGCRLVWGPSDGKLYLTTGDVNQAERAQDLNSLLGKILRLNRDGSIPHDNPFVGRADARPEIWSYGHRNPQGLDFHPVSGELFSSEHGPGGGDEINLVYKGINYGWPVTSHREGQYGIESPLLEFSPAIAPCATNFYRGDAFPELKNNLLVAMLRGQGILAVDLEGSRPRSVTRYFHQSFGRIREIAESPEGYLYLSTSQFDPPEGQPRENYDRILRIVPASVEPGAFPILPTPEPRPSPPRNPGELSPIVEAAEGVSQPPPSSDLATLSPASLAQRFCYSCHGHGLKGGMQSSLTDGQWERVQNDRELFDLIANGILDEGMLPYRNILDQGQIGSLVRYIRDLERQHAPGPPE